MIALEGGMLTGDVKDSVFVNVTLNVLDVVFLNVQKVPAFPVDVVAGAVMLLKEELVR